MLHEIVHNLTRKDLLSLEQYSEKRAEFRDQVMAHKANRKVHIGDHATLYFEDRLTIQYQIQEMLRIEKIFDATGIQEELDAYNPLIPDGKNLKATFMLEYEDIEKRRDALQTLTNIEDTVWIEVNGCEKVFAIADEDLERQNDEKTSAVHFVRLELSERMCDTAKAGAAIAIGIAHENYAHSVDPLPESIRDALVKDLD